MYAKPRRPTHSSVSHQSASEEKELRTFELGLSSPMCRFFQQERWGGVDKRKKRPRNSSREDASIDGMEEDPDHAGEMDTKVIFLFSVSFSEVVNVWHIGAFRCANEGRVLSRTYKVYQHLRRSSESSQSPPYHNQPISNMLKRTRNSSRVAAMTGRRQNR